jgi:CheY-like chemotaxis protein
MTKLVYSSAAETVAVEQTGKLNLLVVEDDEADAYLIGRALSDNPVVGSVAQARNGLEALEMVERGGFVPEIAFIDLRMPLMSGFDLMLAFTHLPQANFPMVVLTSSSAPKDAIRSRLRNAVRVIVKPDTVAEMYAVLQSAIETVCRAGLATAMSARTPAYPVMGRRQPSLRRRPSDPEVPT